MDWVHDPRLWAAAMPFGVFVSAIVAFYFATESGDNDPSPVVHRGETEWEPWGVPVRLRKYRLPGDSVQRTNRVIEHDTTALAVVKDERKHDLAGQVQS